MIKEIFQVENKFNQFKVEFFLVCDKRENERDWKFEVRCVVVGFEDGEGYMEEFESNFQLLRAIC